MKWLLLSRMLGLLVMLVGGSMAFSLPWAFPIFEQAEEFETAGFWGIVAAIGTSVSVGGGLYYLGRKETGAILRKEALAIVGLGWMLSGIAGSLPYLFSGTMRSPGVPMTVIDALFESISGFTTTGASVLTDLEVPGTGDSATAGSPLIPRCVLFWRSFTHWLGGMGIIVLFVAILGQLGAAGKALMRREVPGPITEGVRPRIRETAMVMWTIYMGISFLLMLVLFAEGMSVYDAMCHTFGTMATGGFSTHNASIGYYQSPLIEVTLVLFMIVAGTNFSLFYLAIRRKDPRGRSGILGVFGPFLRDPEFRVYLGILGVSSAVITVTLVWNDVYPHEDVSGQYITSIRHAVFTSVSIMTTTGYGTEDFTSWSEFSKGLLLLLMFVGGCAGSTGGGIKVVRFMLFAKVVRLEIEQAYRPNVVRPMRVFGVPVDNSLRHEVVVYFSLVLMIFICSWMLLAAIEPESLWTQEGHTRAEKLIDCASAVAATLNNIGPGLGVLGPHSSYSDFSQQGKALLTVLMLLGRLELFAILALVVPSFWRVQ